jgi:hypothetical protein
MNAVRMPVPAVSNMNVHCIFSPLFAIQNGFVSTYLANWVQRLVSRFGVDGIRIDTVPEVPMWFWKGYADAAGVYAVGEVENGDPAYVGPYQKQGALPATLAYPLFFQLRNVFQQQQSMNALQTLWLVVSKPRMCLSFFFSLTPYACQCL